MTPRYKSFFYDSFYFQRRMAKISWWSNKYGYDPYFFNFVNEKILINNDATPVWTNSFMQIIRTTDDVIKLKPLLEELDIEDDFFCF